MIVELLEHNPVFTVRRSLLPPLWPSLSWFRPSFSAQHSLCHDSDLGMLSLVQVGYKSVLHIHTACEECEVTKLICEIDPKTKEQKKSR